MSTVDFSAIVDRLDAFGATLIEIRTLLGERSRQLADHEGRIRDIEQSADRGSGQLAQDHKMVRDHENRITELEAYVGRTRGWIAGAAVAGNIAGATIVWLVVTYVLRL